MSLKIYHQERIHSEPDSQQITAWENSFDVLSKELKKISEKEPRINQCSIIFEYELPRERGRRPDVIILGDGVILVIECKQFNTILQAHIDQVEA